MPDDWARESAVEALPGSSRSADTEQREPMTTDSVATISTPAAAFALGDTQYGWDDVALAGRCWGDWVELEERAAHGLACQRRAAAEELVLEAGLTARAAAEFRYARGLVTAQEMEGWLAQWSLTAEQWLGWIERSVLSARWAGEAMAARYAAPADEVAEAVWAEAVCAGALARLAERLAGRVAMAAAAREAGLAGAPAADAAAVLAEMRHQAPGLVLDPACAERLEHLAGLEREFAAACAAALTPAAIGAAIATHQLEWLRAGLVTATFSAEAAAREAACCVREDGLALADVARTAGVPWGETCIVLDDAAPDLRRRLVSAEPGELLGPLPAPDGAVLIAVGSKTLPDAGDAAVRRRAETHVLERVIHREVAARIQWRAPR
jgi:hypothetical protein